MKPLQITGLMLLAALFAGCHRRTSQEETPGPKVTGDKIIFPTNAPQLGYLAIETDPGKESLGGGFVWQAGVG